MANSLAKNMKKAYYDMLKQDLENGDTTSCENLIQDIKERLNIICPLNYKELLEINFRNIPYISPENPVFKEFILMAVDFITLMDAPINDEQNELWRQQMITSNDIPKMLIEIEEHIDVIYEAIIKLNSE